MEIGRESCTYIRYGGASYIYFPPERKREALLLFLRWWWWWSGWFNRFLPVGSWYEQWIGLRFLPTPALLPSAKFEANCVLRVLFC